MRLARLTAAGLRYPVFGLGAAWMVGPASAQAAATSAGPPTSAPSGRPTTSDPAGRIPGG